MEDILDLIETVKNMTDSHYRSLLMAARRAKQLQRGSKPLIKDRKYGKPTLLALQEVRQELVVMETEEERIDVPEAPELPDTTIAPLDEFNGFPEDRIQDFE